MASFEDAIGRVLENEGGYVWDKDDPGGETNFGITKRQYPNLDIKHLTREQACEIYKRDYWFCDGIVNQAVATKLFDTAVNMGRAQAVKLLQKAINALGGGLAVDGQFGPNTLLGTNAANPDALLVDYRRLQAERYGQLVEKNPKLLKFMRGWLKRAAQ